RALWGPISFTKSELVGVQPGTEDPEERGWLLEVGGVAGAGDEGHGGVRADGLAEAVGLGGELGVVAAREDEHRHLQAVQALPQRLLTAGARLAKALSQPVDRVLLALLDELHLGREPGEQRQCEPCVEERLDALALESGGHALV